MTSPDSVPAEDAAEQRLPADGDPGPVPAAGLEAGDADLVEQRQPVGDDGPLAEADRDLPLEADAADAAEQGVAVPADDDVDRR